MMNVDLSLNQDIKCIIPAACFLTPPPPPRPLSRITELIFENNPSQYVTPKIEKNKWSLQALGACKRLSWKACIAVCRCRMFDSWCTSTYKVFQVPITLLCMVDCYTAHCRLIEIIQKIFRKVMINWKTFVRQMQISCISLLTVRVLLASWKSPADMLVKSGARNKTRLSHWWCDKHSCCFLLSHFCFCLSFFPLFFSAVCKSNWSHFLTLVKYA